MYNRSVPGQPVPLEGVCVDEPLCQSITAELKRMAAGEGQAEERALELIYSQLRQIARRMMRSERPDHTLQPTALVNEAWLKLATGQERNYEDREHFFCVAARAMRQILLDHARSRLRHRRRPDADALARLQADAVVQDPVLDVLALDQALNRLAERDGRLAKIFELRSFGDLSVEETANVLGLSPTTVKREWRMAKALLLQDLEGSTHAVPR